MYLVHFLQYHQRGRKGEKQELHPKATSLELVEDKHCAIYVEQRHLSIQFCAHHYLVHYKNWRSMGMQVCCTIMT